MPNVLAATLEVSMDEYAFHLTERNLLAPDCKSRRRYQIILLNRGDRLAEYREDLGPAESFTADQVDIPGGVHDERTGRYELLHTVGELREIADMLREGPPPIEVEPAPLWDRLLEQTIENQKRLTNISTFGPRGKVERN